MWPQGLVLVFSKLLKALVLVSVVEEIQCPIGLAKCCYSPVNLEHLTS